VCPDNFIFKTVNSKRIQKQEVLVHSTAKNIELQRNFKLITFVFKKMDIRATKQTVVAGASLKGSANGG
jgi:hypothetical protein